MKRKKERKKAAALIIGEFSHEEICIIMKDLCERRFTKIDFHENTEHLPQWQKYDFIIITEEYLEDFMGLAWAACCRKNVFSIKQKKHFLSNLIPFIRNLIPKLPELPEINKLAFDFNNNAITSIHNLP